ncbi:MAG: DUF4157 domain-containing protein [Candidatus Nitrotoga sp.]|nr:DUF4157 domain-containing protein [Candidatus Nitrotoga sp.]
MNKATVVQQAKTASFLPPAQGLLQRKCICCNHTIAGGKCAGCAKNKTGLERQLAIGQSNDPLEQEADRVAEQVMAAQSHSAVSSAPPRIQRYAGQATEELDTVPASVDRVLSGSGRPLDAAIQQDMGQRFGHDFSQVRVHTSPAAEQSARDVNAHAYTVGQNIVFGAGRFVPGSHEGQRLLAHELTHVVQQSGADRTNTIKSNLNHGLSRVSAPCARTGDSGKGSPEFTNLVPGDANDVVPTRGELSGSPGACVVQSAMPYSRSGIIRTSGGSVFERFEVRAEWSSAQHRDEASYCAAECGEYHQFVKGYLKTSSNKDGSDLKDVSGKVFGGKPLDEKVFQEDGLDNNPKARYGHRNEKQTMNEKYEPDRATGTKYVGKDAPGVHIGTFADFDLTFIGKLVDTCQGTETVSDPWRVFYRGVIRP